MYRRLVPPTRTRPLACRLILKILHEGIRCEERGPAVSEEAKKVRARKMIRELRSLGYRVEFLIRPDGFDGGSRLDRRFVPTLAQQAVTAGPRECSKIRTRSEAMSCDVGYCEPL